MATGNNDALSGRNVQQLLAGKSSQMFPSELSMVHVKLKSPAGFMGLKWTQKDGNIWGLTASQFAADPDGEILNLMTPMVSSMQGGALLTTAAQLNGSERYAYRLENDGLVDWLVELVIADIAITNWMCNIPDIITVPVSWPWVVDPGGQMAGGRMLPFCPQDGDDYWFPNYVRVYGYQPGLYQGIPVT